MLKRLSFALLALSGLPTRAQTPTGCTVYATEASSQAWVAHVRELPLPQQVQALRQRAACDAHVQGPEPAVCLMLLSPAQRQSYATRQQQAEAADKRPRGAVLCCFMDGRAVTPADLPEFYRLLASGAVKKIDFLAGPSATAIYGTWGAGGVARVMTH